MISVITIDSGSSQNAMSSFIPPMFIHAHKSSSMKRCSGWSPIILTKPDTAIGNAAKDHAATDEADGALAEAALDPGAQKKIDRRADQRQQYNPVYEANAEWVFHGLACRQCSDERLKNRFATVWCGGDGTAMPV